MCRRPIGTLARSGYDNGPVLETDAGRLRFQRRLLHAALGQGQVHRYQDAHEYHVQTFLRNLAQDPEHYFYHIRQYVLLRFCEAFPTYTRYSWPKMWLQLSSRDHY